MKKAKQAVLVVATAAEVEKAMELLDTGILLGELQTDYFGMVRDAVTSGCTFEGLESAQPGLQEIGAYRSAKSVIRNAKKQNKKLVNRDGTAKTKSALSAELKPTNAKGKRAGKKRANSKVTPSKIDTLQSAFAILKAEPSMRRAYRTEIMETARMLANDDAVKGERPRAAIQLEALKAAADKQAQVAPAAQQKAA